MKLPVKKKYTNRHNILSVLYDNFNEYNYPGAEPNDLLITFRKLATSSNISDNELRDELAFLYNESELFDKEIQHNSYYGITSKGSAAFTNSKYLNLGKDDLWGDIKNYIALIAFIISIFVFFWNIYNGNEISKLKYRIEKLEKK